MGLRSINATREAPRLLSSRPRLDRKKYRRQRIAIDIREFRVDLFGIQQSRRVDHVQLIIARSPSKKQRVVRGEDPRHRRKRLTSTALRCQAFPENPPWSMACIPATAHPRQAAWWRCSHR